MTRTEMRQTRNRQFRKDSLTLLTILLVPFVLGFLTHWFICQFTHEDTYNIELSGSATIYIVDSDSETSEPEETEETEKAEESVFTPDPEVEESEKFISYYKYTEEELDLLARLIYSEGGTESYETKLKIGSVVMNRVSEDKYFPDTIREVIYQKNQFSVTTTKIGGVVMIDRPADEESIRAAREVLDYGSVLPPDVQVFYADWLKGESWVTTRKVFGTFDNTVFAYIYAKDGVM